MLLAALFATATLAAHADEGFFRVAEADLSPNVSRASQSVLHLDTGPDECSGSLISKSGHVLTALHCVVSELREAGLLEESTSNGMHWARVKDQSPKNVNLNHYSLRTGGLGETILARAPKIVFLGQGLAWPEGETITLPEKGVGFLSEDYAILKFELAEPTVPCAKLAAAVPAPGARVWAIGFPGPAKRANGKNSDGVSKLVTKGAVHGSLADSPWLKSASLTSADYAELDAYYLAPRALLADTDGFHGMSGGMFADENGRLVGLYSSSYSTDEAYVETSALAVSTAFIATEARAKLGDKATAEIFGCE